MPLHPLHTAKGHGAFDSMLLLQKLCMNGELDNVLPAPPGITVRESMPGGGRKIIDAARASGR